MKISFNDVPVGQALMGLLDRHLRQADERERDIIVALGVAAWNASLGVRGAALGTQIAEAFGDFAIRRRLPLTDADRYGKMFRMVALEKANQVPHLVQRIRSVQQRQSEYGLVLEATTMESGPAAAADAESD